jgi:hypothetical protein
LKQAAFEAAEEGEVAGRKFNRGSFIIRNARRSGEQSNVSWVSALAVAQRQR